MVKMILIWVSIGTGVKLQKGKGTGKEEFEGAQDGSSGAQCHFGKLRSASGLSISFLVGGWVRNIRNYMRGWLLMH